MRVLVCGGRLRGWLEDWAWAWRVRRVRALRRRLTFSRRLAFDREFQPLIDGGRIAYPDAFYHTKREDWERARKAAIAEMVKKAKAAGVEVKEI